MRFIWQGAAHDLPRPSLTGAHQVGNASMALACLAVLGIAPPAAQAEGLTRAVWPARLQKLREARGHEIWFDGGHNESCARILAAQAQRWREEDGKPLHLIIGMMGSKNPEAFIAPLAPYAASITAVPVREPKAFAAQELAVRLNGKAADSVAAAIRGAAPGRVLITGSFYLYGEAVS
jgi:dihydrofolate synthase/folylpolyglutamate synthase